MGLKPRHKPVAEDQQKPLTEKQIQEVLDGAPLRLLVATARSRGCVVLDGPLPHWHDLSPHHRTMVIDVLTEQAAKYRLANAMWRETNPTEMTPFNSEDVAGALRATRLTLQAIDGLIKRYR